MNTTTPRKRKTAAEKRAEQELAVARNIDDGRKNFEVNMRAVVALLSELEIPHDRSWDDDMRPIVRVQPGGLDHILPVEWMSDFGKRERYCNWLGYNSGQAAYQEWLGDLNRTVVPFRAAVVQKELARITWEDKLSAEERLALVAYPPQAIADAVKGDVTWQSSNCY